MIKHLFTGVVKPDGQSYFRPGQKQRMTNYIRTLKKDVDVFIAFSVQVVKRKRSLPQNNLYYLRRDILSNETGINAEELHRICLERCGFGKYMDIVGKKEFIRESSTNLSVEEFSRLMKEQDTIAEFFNEGKEPDLWLKLPSTEEVNV